MRKYLIWFLILYSVPALAQPHSWTFKVGGYFPKDLKTGMMYSIDYGQIIDEHVTILFGGDFYYRSIRNDASLGNSENLGVKIGEFEHLSEWTGWHLPLTIKAKISFPADNLRIVPYGVAGIGYGVTHVSYDLYREIPDPPLVNSHSNNVEVMPSSSLTYSGFVWQAGGGVMYRLGRSSDLTAEVMYNGAMFEKDEENNRYTTLNSSGITVRAGLVLYIF